MKLWEVLDREEWMEFWDGLEAQKRAEREIDILTKKWQ